MRADENTYGEDLTWLEAANSQWAYRAEHNPTDDGLALYGARADDLRREEEAE